MTTLTARGGPEDGGTLTVPEPVADRELIEVDGNRYRTYARFDGSMVAVWVGYTSPPFYDYERDRFHSTLHAPPARPTGTEAAAAFLTGALSVASVVFMLWALGGLIGWAVDTVGLWRFLAGSALTGGLGLWAIVELYPSTFRRNR